MNWLAILVYIVAIGIPVALLFRYKSQAWYWHVLAVAAGLALGFIPTPQQLKTGSFDLLFGGLFILLMIWGIGGLVIYRPHLHKHA